MIAVWAVISTLGPMLLLGALGGAATITHQYRSDSENRSTV